MKLFESISLGEITLKNRIVMAPMTRSRALDNIPNDLMAKYYGQRADAGLIITEGTSPTANGIGYARIPGAYSPEQIAGWKLVADKVHQNNGNIFVQLMHCGRVSAKDNIPMGETISASAIQLMGEMYTDTSGMQSHDVPKEMSDNEITEVITGYATAAKELINTAKIDGVELHAANGYLLDQFLNPKSNVRTDEYGGDYKKRARFVLETAQKTVDAIGGDKVGIRFSPYGVFNDMQGEFDDTIEMYTYLAQELSKMNISYIHIADQRVAMGAPDFSTDIKKTIQNNFNGIMIVGGDVDSTEKGEALITEGYDLVYVGRPFISNPTLVSKLKEKIALVQPDFETAYTADANGYTDYI
jgi:N-ethylmaleimide reductase